MTVNQELDFAWRAENGRNLGRAIPQPISFSQKSAGVGLRILRVDIMPFVG